MYFLKKVRVWVTRLSGQSMPGREYKGKGKVGLQLIGQETVMMPALLVQSMVEISQSEHELDCMIAVWIWVFTLS